MHDINQGHFGNKQGIICSAAAYQTNRSLFDKSTKIGTHID